MLNRPPLTNLSLPSGGEHQVPIRLLTGFPRSFVFILAALLGVTTVLAVNLPGLQLWIAATVSVCVVLLCIHWFTTTIHAPRMALVIFPDGQVQYVSRGGGVIRGQLGKHSWQRFNLICIEVRFTWGVELYPVFRSSQQKGEFRRLKVWLRNSRTEDLAIGF